MSRQLSKVSYNSFVKGLITEAGPLNFPENSTIEDMNCVLTLKGSHKRRYGISEEADGAPLEYEYYWQNENPIDGGVESSVFNEHVVHSYTWKSPNNIGTKTFLVIQICERLYFFDISERGAIAYQKIALSVDLSNFIVDALLFKSNGCSFTSGKGYLFVCGKGLEPFYISYDDKEDSLFAKNIDLKIRDVDGVDDSLNVDEQPSTLSDEHLYNLLNQGWIYPKQTIVQEEEAILGNLHWENEGRHTGNSGRTNYYFVNGKQVFARYSSHDGYMNTETLVSWFNEISAADRAYITAYFNGTEDILFKADPAHPCIGTTIRIQSYYKKHRYLDIDASTVMQRSTPTFKQAGTPFDDYYNEYKKYPSNVQQWFVGRSVGEQINLTEVKQFDFGTQRAPRGRLLINPFTENRNIYVPSLPKSTDKKRVTDIAFLGGRVFYLRDGEVLFSQVLTDISNANKCYQEGDPTSEDAFDLVPTDGGVIPIQGMGEACALKEIFSGLLVFGSNGVWLISGLSAEEGFKATSFSVRRITTIDCCSRESIVSINGTPIYWSSNGIYALEQGELGNISCISLSQGTVQSLYKDIPIHNLKHVKGIYDSGCSKIYWLYDSTNKEDTVPAHRKTKGLVYDIRLQAFYEMSFDKNDRYPYICEAFNTPWLSSVDFEEEVLDNEGNIVLDNDEEIVYTKTAFRNTDLTDVRYLAYQNINNKIQFTVCSFDDLSFTDWKRSNREGVPFESYFTTGYNTGGDSSLIKDVVYLTTQLSRTEDAFKETEVSNSSSCFLQMRWDFENNSYSGKWTEPRQIYRANRIFAPSLEDPNYDYRGLPVVTTKHKVRGNGRALQMKFTSEPGKNFEVLGWSAILGGRP